MSVYNIMFGVSPMAMFVVPTLFENHPDQLPRFRDAFFLETEDDYEIKIIARVGKKYHGGDYNEEVYMNHPNFIRFEDKLITEWNEKTLIDDTYGNYFFSIPEKYRDDLLKANNRGQLSTTTPGFQKLILDTYPKIYKNLIRLFTDKSFMNE